MYLQNSLLFTLLGLGAALLTNIAHAQSSRSSSLIESRIVAAQAKDSIKVPAKTIRLVSRSTIPVGNSPLYVVDGKLIQEQEFKSINPNDIDKIEIIKENTATAIYGSRATNGVILVTMKHSHAKPPHQPTIKKGRFN